MLVVTKKSFKNKLKKRKNTEVYWLSSSSSSSEISMNSSCLEAVGGTGLVGCCRTTTAVRGTSGTNGCFLLMMIGSFFSEGTGNILATLDEPCRCWEMLRAACGRAEGQLTFARITLLFGLFDDWFTGDWGSALNIATMFPPSLPLVASTVSEGEVDSFNRTLTSRS